MISAEAQDWCMPSDTVRRQAGVGTQNTFMTVVSTSQLLAIAQWSLQGSANQHSVENTDPHTHTHARTNTHTYL